MRSIEPAYDLEFCPNGYGSDPLCGVFSPIGDKKTERTVWRLHSQERIEEMETALRWAGFLRPDGAFDLERYPDIEDERPEHIEGAEITIAELSSGDFSNTVGAVRIGWFWEITGHFDGAGRTVLARSTTPISMEALIAILDDTQLVDHFREAGEDDVIWSSVVYPHLEQYYTDEAERWEDELLQDAEEEEGDE